MMLGSLKELFEIVKLSVRMAAGMVVGFVLGVGIVVAFMQHLLPISFAVARLVKAMLLFFLWVLEISL